MNKSILLLAAALCGALALSAGQAEQWAKAFSGDSVKRIEGNNLDIYYLEECTVPGPGKSKPETDAMAGAGAAAVEDDFDEELDVVDIFGNLEEVSESRLERLKESLTYCQKQLETAQKRVDSISADIDDESAAYAEKQLAKAKQQKEAAERDIKELEERLQAKAAKKAKAEEAAKAEVAKAEEAKPKAKAGKPGKGEGAKKPKPETHEEKTSDYYELPKVMEEADGFANNARAELGSSSQDWSSHRGKVYVVTSQKAWNALRGKPSGMTPARNAAYEKNARAFLVYASPRTTNYLSRTIGYVVAAEMLDEWLTIHNPKGAPCEAIKVGFAAYVSGLKDVVDCNKVTTLPYLMENKMLLPAQLFSTDRLDAPERCLYFTRQSSALVGHILINNQQNFRNYLEVVTGGNSGFRNSFQYLELNPSWADSYDEFCNNLNFRIFFPLTKEAATVPTALNEWEQQIREEDKEYRETRESVKERQAKARSRGGWRRGSSSVKYH